jgi:ketosteroid isomerase-like protein
MGTDSWTVAEVNEICQVSLRWAKAVASANVNELGELMTEDIVVVHGDGRTILRREAVMMDFAHGFERFRIEQTLVPEETFVAGTYAFDRAKVQSSLFDRVTGEKREVASETFTILRKEELNRWRVARSIGVVIRQS